MSCAMDVCEKLVGNWKFVTGTEPEKTMFPTVEYLRQVDERGYYQFIDDKRLGYASLKGDTLNSFPYDVRQDTMFVHTNGADAIYKFEFASNDPLVLQSQGIQLIYSRMK
jgi:hypothetical protein